MCSAAWAVVALIASLYWMVRPSSHDRWGLGEVAGTWGFGVSVGALLVSAAPPPWSQTSVWSLVPALLAFAAPAAGFGAGAACIVRVKYRLPLTGLGLRFDHVRRRVAEGVLGGATAVAASGVGQVVTFSLLALAAGHAAPITGTGPQGCLRTIYDVLPRLKGNMVDVALAAVVIGVAVPIGEELLFRGLALGALRQLFSRHLAIAVSALVFAGAHLQPAQLLALGALGLVLGYLYDLTGSLLPGMIAHGLHNLFMLYVVQLPRM